MTAIKTDTHANDLEAALKFQEMSLDELRAEAAKLGVKLQTTDSTEIIDQLIAASVEQPATAEAGMLFSLHSRDTEARNMILRARNVILQNEQAGKTFSLFLKNREGSFYTQRAPGCKVSPEKLAKIMRIISTLPDGSQTQVLEELETNPGAFEDPALVRLRRRNDDGSYSNYVMLYVKRKQKLVEQSF
jgi:hypothetical protein